MIRRWMFTGVSFLSLLLCMATLVLWIHGRGRAAGWYFRPSASFVIQPPEGQDLPDEWCVQWQINWGNPGELTIDRQVKPVKSPWPWPMRIGWYSHQMTGAKRWNPLPEPQLPLRKPPAMTRMPGGVIYYSLPRTRPETHWQFIGIQYNATEQDFAQFSNGKWGPNIGERNLIVPLLWLFLVFAILPIIWTWRAVRSARRRRLIGCCRTCGYNLTANMSGVCPECGEIIPAAGIPGER